LLLDKNLKKSKKEPRKLWINAEITESIEERNNLYCLYLEFSTQENLENFERAKNFVNSLRRSSATNYYSEKFRENAGDMKGTWQTMNDVLKGERKNCRIDETLVERKRVT